MTPLRAVELDAPVSSTNVLAPGPVEATTEIRLTDWETMSLTTLGDGRHELVARARAGSTVNAHFVSAKFTLTAAPAGIEIVDGLIDSAANVAANFGAPLLRQPPFTVLLLDTITLRAPAGTFTPEAAFFAALGGAGFTWSKEAAEQPVLASGVFVVEDLVAGLDYGAPFLGRRALDDDNHRPPVIHANLGGGVYRFVFPQADLRTQWPEGTTAYDIAVGSWSDKLKNSDTTSFFSPFTSAVPTDPIVTVAPTHTALILISDPVKRAALSPEAQALLPPPSDLPRQFVVTGYYPQLLPTGETICAFNIILNMADPPPLNLPVYAIFQSATLVGAFGTSENESGPADTLGSAQGDPLSPDGENGLVAPQYWPQRGIEIADGLRMDGQASLEKIKARVRLRIRFTPWPDFSLPPAPPLNVSLEVAGELTAAASLTVTAEHEIDIGRKTIQVVPPVTLPVAFLPLGPVAIGLSITTRVEGGAEGNISLAGSFGWSQTTKTSFSAVVTGGRDLTTGEAIPITTSFTGSRSQAPDSQSGPFLDTETTADLRGFISASVGLNVSVIPLASAEVAAGVELFADLHVDPKETPWWGLSTGVDPFISLTGRILGFVIAQVRSQSDDLPEVSAPHLAATSPPDPLGRPAGGDIRWAKALTYANLPIAADAIDVVPLPNKGLVMLSTLPSISLLLVELDAYGAEVRRRVLGSILHTTGHPKRVRLLPDGGLLVFASPVVIRLDAAWNVVWKKSLAATAGNTVRFYDMDVAPGAGTDFAAYFAATTALVAGTDPTSAVVLKMDADGAAVWTKAFTAQGEESFYAIRATPDGGCVAGGKTDAAWSDPREDEFRDLYPTQTNPFPDETDNGYLVRIAPDGSVLWAWAAAAISFDSLAVQPDGRVGAAGSRFGHGFYEQWKGPSVHLFNPDGSRGGATSFTAIGMPGVHPDGNLDDYAGSITTGTDGGWVLSCKTGPADQTPAASFIVALTPGLYPKWLIGYDWLGSPREVPDRIINRGDSYFFLSLLDDGRLNGAAAVDAILLSCLPDTGLCSLLPSNRLTHGFFGPGTDSFGGRGVIDLEMGGAPRAITPSSGSSSQIAINNYAPNITNPASTTTFTPLTDLIPAGPAPQPCAEAGAAGAFEITWPAAGAAGYSLFESTDLTEWNLSGIVPQLEAGEYKAPVSTAGPGMRKYWRLERTAPAQ